MSHSYSKFTRLLFSTLILSMNLICASAQSGNDSLKIITGAEVRVSSKKPLIEQDLTKTVINVQSDLLAAGSTVFEILQKAPGVTVTGEDIINLSGKPGVNVLIDGRPTQLAGRDLSAYLKSMQGSTIDKIEIITNPSAKYEANGNAGIINIRLKKIKQVGTNGNLSAGYTQNVHYRSNLTGNLNHREGRINFYSSIGGDFNQQHTSGYINRNVRSFGIEKNFLNTTTDNDRNRSYQFRTGVDFFANKKQTLGLLISGNGNRSPFSTPGSTLITTDGKLDSSLVTGNDNLYNNNRFNANLNYKYEDTLGRETNIDADFTRFNNSNLTKLNTLFLDGDGKFKRTTFNQLDVATGINIYAIKIDHSRKLSFLHSKLETGLKFSRINTGNDLAATIMNTGVTQADTGRSNRFQYHETVAAAYAGISSNIKKLEYQLGLRIEYSMIRGKSAGLGGKAIQQPDSNYINAFPSIFISYPLSEKNKLGFSYSRRIERPNYQALNPFETIYDLYTSEKGNPYLRPSYSDNAEIKYCYHYALNVAIGFTHTSDYSQTVTRQVNNNTQATTENIGTVNNFYINIGSPLKFRSWWTGYINLTGFQNGYNVSLPGGRVRKQVYGMNYYIQQSFSLGKEWNMQASSWFNSGTKDALFKTKWLGSLDASISKSFSKKGLRIAAGIIDIFNTQRWEQHVKFADQDFIYHRKWESRGVKLQLGYTFGKGKFRERERETNKDAERIKTRS